MTIEDLEIFIHSNWDSFDSVGLKILYVKNFIPISLKNLKLKVEQSLNIEDILPL